VSDRESDRLLEEYYAGIFRELLEAALTTDPKIKVSFRRLPPANQAQALDSVVRESERLGRQFKQFLEQKGRAGVKLSVQEVKELTERFLQKHAPGQPDD
jgi:hypothetical protein